MIDLAADVEDDAADAASLADLVRQRRQSGATVAAVQSTLDQLRLLRHQMRTHGDRIADLTVAATPPPPAASTEVAQMAALVERITASLLSG